MLVLAAFQLADGIGEFRFADHAQIVSAGEAYIERQGGIVGLKARYGKDKTFAVPILANTALADRVPWSEVSALPFEFAALPQSWYHLMRLPVVSYAIPALVAIGQAIFFHRKPWNPLVRWIRTMAIKPSIAVLERMQPASGGYLEAIPLTSFVTMSLAATGRADHPITKNAVRFIRESIRPDGSWPIDTNLATWVTTLAVNGLDDQDDWDRIRCWDWILSCQNTEVHPFTGAAPGGWGWTDLSGAVPDADDTPGALLALRRLYDSTPSDSDEHAARQKRTIESAKAGLRWLLDLQNRDGGWPTFCRGWGQLPFDRSGTDLTAHAIRALHAWRDLVDPVELQNATASGWRYIERMQNDDGSWLPLWFGNQEHTKEENPIYGTSKVLMAYRDLGLTETMAARRGFQFLIDSQELSGRWGVPQGPAAGTSVEETALAIEALCAIPSDFADQELASKTLEKGIRALILAIQTGEHRKASPIGLYFAKLWYYEKLYPMTFAVSALRELIETREMRTVPPVIASSE
jgi:squalene-hopene/tetraprenyl-beta-curcumene cyclase